MATTIFSGTGNPITLTWKLSDGVDTGRQNISTVRPTCRKRRLTRPQPHMAGCSFAVSCDPCGWMKRSWGLRDGLSTDNPEQHITLAWFSPKAGGQGWPSLINQLPCHALEAAIPHSHPPLSLLTTTHVPFSSSQTQILLHPSTQTFTPTERKMECNF